MSGGWLALARRRPVGAARQLRPGSEACPLSLRDLLGVTAALRIPLPIFRAPLPEVIRGVLLAGRRAACAVGLTGGGGAPETWFAEVVAAAEELAPRLPFFVSAAIRVEPGGGGVELAAERAQGLVEAGATHLAVDLSRIPPAERARAAAAVARVAGERDLAVELILGPEGTLPAEGEAGALLAELRGTRFPPDALGFQPGPAAGVEGIRAEARALVRLSGAIPGCWLVRRGPAPTAMLPVCRAIGLAAVEDGGAALLAALEGLPREARAAALGAEGGRHPARMGAGGPAARAEAVAFAEASAFIEGLGSTGSARAATGALAPGEPG